MGSLQRNSMEQAVRKISRHFRARRMRRFQRLFRLTEATRILDIGGTPFNWELLDVRPAVTLLNTPRGQEDVGVSGFTFVSGDGCRLPFADQSFDVVFSNSVIEHVGGTARQRQFAREVTRVGRSYYVQTPNLFFPVEQHLLTPFLHLLPRRWQRWLAPRFTVWALLVRPSEDRRKFYIEHFLNDVRLLTRRSLGELFPHDKVRRELWLGLTKSLIVMRINS